MQIFSESVLSIKHYGGNGKWFKTLVAMESDSKTHELKQLILM